MKYKEDSSAYAKYGPYALVDQATNTIFAAHLDGDAVERELFAPAASTAQA